MRVLQLIDSLDAGGAERIAVSFANALASKIEFSGLVATRKEGQLLDQLSENVSYLFLSKKAAIDYVAIFKLRSFIVKNNVTIIHAHGSSFFTAVLTKLILPKIRIIWHDHYGTRYKESRKKNQVLIFCSAFFSSIFVVNLQLKEWSKRNMLCKNVNFIPNFSSIEENSSKITFLKGRKGKRLVFLANLKNPKNHIVILKAFKDLELKNQDWTLHLIGTDYEDDYSEVLKDFIKKNLLENHIHLYGNRSDIQHILSQSDIGVLASTDEGFPVTLLEYALANLAVISTNAGYCSEIIEDGKSGLLFDPFNESEINEKFKIMIENELPRAALAKNFNETVVRNYSKEVVIEKLTSKYRNEEEK